jgi:hypothetical protein
MIDLCVPAAGYHPVFLFDFFFFSPSFPCVRLGAGTSCCFFSPVIPPSTRFFSSKINLIFSFPFLPFNVSSSSARFSLLSESNNCSIRRASLFMPVGFSAVFGTSAGEAFGSAIEVSGFERFASLRASLATLASSFHFRFFPCSA